MIPRVDGMAPKDIHRRISLVDVCRRDQRSQRRSSVWPKTVQSIRRCRAAFMPPIIGEDGWGKPIVFGGYLGGIKIPLPLRLVLRYYENPNMLGHEGEHALPVLRKRRPKGSRFPSKPGRRSDP